MKNSKPITMKKLLLSLILLLSYSITYSQLVYKVKKKKDADLIYYVTDKKEEATKVVFITKYQQKKASETLGLWFFLSYPVPTAHKIYLTTKKKEAKEIIYFAKSENEFYILNKTP